MLETEIRRRTNITLNASNFGVKENRIYPEAKVLQNFNRILLIFISLKAHRSCDCALSPFRYAPHGYVITGGALTNWHGGVPNGE